MKTGVGAFTHRAALKHNLKSLIAGTICLIAVDSLFYSLPMLMKLMIDQLSTHAVPVWFPESFKNLSSFHFILAISAIYFGITLMIMVGRYYWRVFLIWSSFGWFHELRCALFEHVQSLHRDFFKTRKVGDLISCLTSDTENMRMTLSIGALMCIDAVINFMIFPFLLWRLNHQLALIIVPPLLLSSMSTLRVSTRLSKLYEDVQNIAGSLSGKAYEMMSGVRAIKAFHRESELHEDFSKESHRLKDASMRVARFQIFFVPGLEFVLSLAVCVTLIFGGYKVIRGEMSLGNLVAFHLYLLALDWPMMAMGWFTQLFRQSKASEKRIHDLIGIENPLQAERSTQIPEWNVNGLFEIEKLSYRYPDGSDFIFEGLNLQLKAGDWVGLTGPVGSGKSTFLELLSRQRDPTLGHIRLSGVDLKNLSVEEVRKVVLYVPQEAFTFSKSLSFNLNLGIKPQVPDARLWELLEDLSFHRSEIEDRGGLSTRLGERGLNLSGGQRQRVSLGRALLRKRMIYLLDDLFSQVDTETEAKLLLAVKKNLPPDAIVILVSQRLATLEQMDQILVVDQKQCRVYKTPKSASEQDEFLQHLRDVQQEQSVWA